MVDLISGERGRAVQDADTGREGTDTAAQCFRRDWGRRGPGEEGAEECKNGRVEKKLSYGRHLLMTHILSIIKVRRNLGVSQELSTVTCKARVS